jgi:hypothetical protein
MLENGNAMKNQFDQYGTIVKSMSVMNHGKDTMKIKYLPKYENGVVETSMAACRISLK